LAEALHAYIAAAGLADDREGWLFRTSRGHDATVLADRPMGQPDAWRMIRKRTVAVGIYALIGNHSFRATDRRLMANQIHDGPPRPFVSHGGRVARTLRTQCR
jgi:hypothetical protein